MSYDHLLNFNTSHLSNMNKDILIKIFSDEKNFNFIKQKAHIPEQKHMYIISRYTDDGILLYYVLQSENNYFTINTHSSLYDNEIINLFSEDYIKNFH